MVRTALCSLALLFFLTSPLHAEDLAPDPVEQFKQYLNEVVTEVKETDDPAEKRALLDESLRRMKTAAERVKQTPGIHAEDEKALTAFVDDLSDKRNQLHGLNGYEAVPDADLDRFADYVQQDLEQAQRLVISISTATLVLLVFLLLLL